MVHKLLLYIYKLLILIFLFNSVCTESRKRKSRNWEEEDFYDSDEDIFLDRTGTVEKKREQRMRMAGKLETKAETYDSLVYFNDISNNLVIVAK